MEHRIESSPMSRSPSTDVAQTAQQELDSTDTASPIDTDASLLPERPLESTYRTINGVQLHVVTGGNSDGPLVVLLHGHPDFWYGWRDQIGALIDDGFRVVVPDQRGANLSEAPDGIDAYRQAALAADVRELIHSEGRESAHIVGHDFGGFVAWNVALRYPSLVDRLGILNVPHPTVYRETLRSSPQQIARSWYVWFYQIPKLPEWLLGRNDMSNMVDSLEITSNPGTFDDETIARYKAAWRHTGVAPRIHWYRGFRRSDPPTRDTVTQPTLICWGEGDIALLPDMATKTVDYCENVELRTFPDASHWVHHERTEVTTQLTQHLCEAQELA